MTTPFIPWLGGKTRLLKDIVPLIPQHQCYVEVFAGAGALFFAKQPSEVEVINDVNDDLINLYRVVQNHFEEFYRQFKWALSSRKLFDWAKTQTTHQLTDIQRAGRFFYLQKLAFSGKVQGQSFGTATTTFKGLNLLRIEEELSAAHLRLSNTYIENLNWDVLVEKYDRSHTLFFLDPPYWQTEGYGVDFDWENYERLKKVMQNIKGNAILTINNHPEIAELFKDFPQQTVDIKYSISCVHGEPKNAQELIIRSSDFQPQQMLF